MPIYEYQCQECGKVFEAIQKFSDPELTACRCEKAAPVKKLISAAAFHLKGSGWYVTDFRDKGKKKPAEGEKAGTEAASTGDKSATEKSGSDKAGAESKSTKPDSTSTSAAAD